MSARGFWLRQLLGVVGSGLAAVLVAAVSGQAPARAEERGRFAIIEENDFLQPQGTDRHYTQGAMLSYLSPLLDSGGIASQVYGPLGSLLPIFQPGLGVRRKFDVVAGQSIFTPREYHRFPLNPNDRPFAGWLYTGGSLLQETGGTMLENFEVLAGVVGPDSLADITQQSFHKLINFYNPELAQTWKTQLSNEPGIVLTYERKWRLWQSTLFGMETEVIPEAGITAGNIFTYADGGFTLRIGRDLGVDYGPARVRPSISGTHWFDADRLTQPWGWYVFGGAQGRAVARNIFLDGNTFTDSRSVDKNILVGSFTVGGSVFYKDTFKIDLTLTETTKEFKTQSAMDHFGALSVSFRY